MPTNDVIENLEQNLARIKETEYIVLKHPSNVSEIPSINLEFHTNIQENVMIHNVHDLENSSQKAINDTPQKSLNFQDYGTESQDSILKRSQDSNFCPIVFQLLHPLVKWW